jgi:hypothetical protein
MAFNPLTDGHWSGAGQPVGLPQKARGQNETFVHLDELSYQQSTSSGDEGKESSTSALMNDNQGYCPKCKAPFGSAIVDGEAIMYCEPCRVSQPMPSDGAQ